MSLSNVEMDAITQKIIGCAFSVGNKLGVGFLEKVYENALIYELQKAGLKVQAQVPVQVKYETEIVGDFVYDLLVENEVVVELKAVKALDAVHMSQCLNYLKATELKVCLLINFGKKKIEFRRIVDHF
jgi:GxxExxY protein